MRISNAQKEYCMHNLVSMIVESLSEEYPNVSPNKLLADFSQSETYAKLYNPKTRLWAEGPDYVLGLYAEENNLDISFLSPTFI